ncbi:translation elongation factor Ts [Immundisolibacter sp.]|uniref:translation elongation factor Ts n=1 Tax=Immundisolibacter sp. TaxID=1934948 RepID=UPI0019AC3C1C|nr:translation elongation factor Ts [Immundisolibacter sp.]MBC7161708.1 elongation factor Ts [Immundisolibacter sp.]MEA3220384.1 Elongation factor Ts [Immundisolibacter sp.]
MNISAALVKEMRERTGLGMMECKKALTEAGGDIEVAIDLMRKAGAARADKKAGRIAADGAIILSASADGRSVALTEVNSETDFVAKDAGFLAFAQAVGDLVLSQAPADVEQLSALTLGDGTVEEARQQLVAKIGENIRVRRFVRRQTTSGVIGSYLHGSRIGVLVELEGGDLALARDIAMHVAASRPLCVSSEQIPADVIAREKEIYDAQAAESGKPEDIRARMVEGRLRKYAAEVTLLGQPFVKDPDTTVEQLLKKANARVIGFDRLEVGEGIEKQADDFVAEVMKQARG